MAPGTATERVLAALTRIEEVERPEVWIALRDPEDLLAEATARDAEAPGSLHGRLIAVKDNIDVAGLPTTAGCPAFAYEPAADAPAVARLRAAGAIVLGKTNLDQFATGLVGSPAAPAAAPRSPSPSGSPMPRLGPTLRGPGGYPQRSRV
jgi:allophanate hydrolase